MSVVYSISKQLEKIGQQAGPRPDPELQAKINTVANKMLDNLDSDLQVNVAQNKDPEIYIRDLASLKRFIDYSAKNNVQFGKFKLVLTPDEWNRLPDQAQKSAYFKYDPSNVYVHKDGTLNYIKQLEIKVTSENNKLGQVMIGSLMTEVNSVLGGGQTPAPAPDQNVTVFVPRAVDLNNWKTKGDIILPLSSLKDTKTLLGYCKNNGMTYTNGPDKNAPNGNLDNEKTVCYFVNWLQKRVNEDNTIKQEIRTQFLTAIAPLVQVCATGQTGQADSGQALGGLPIPIGEPLDLRKIDHFLTVIQGRLKEGTPEQQSFSNLFADYFRIDPKDSNGMSQVKAVIGELHGEITRAQGILQTLYPLLNRTLFYTKTLDTIENFRLVMRRQDAEYVDMQQVCRNIGLVLGAVKEIEKRLLAGGQAGWVTLNEQEQLIDVWTGRFNKMHGFCEQGRRD